MNAQARIVYYEGIIKERTGAFIGIVPPSLPNFRGFIEYDNTIFVDGVAGATADTGDILNARINLGNLCVAFDVAECDPWSSPLAITSIDADVTFIEQLYHDDEAHTGRLFIVGDLETPVSLTLSLIMDFDWGNMSWAVDGGFFGTMSGCVGTTINGARTCGAPPSFPEIPIPAAAWLFSSALFGLGIVKRKRG